MPVPNTIADLNQVAASNSPLGTDTVGPNLDDYLRAISAFVRQLFDGTPLTLGAIGGTGDAITATTASAPFTAYVLGQVFRFVPTASNTGTVTININGIGTKNITKNGAVPLVASDLLAGVASQIFYDGTQFQLLTVPGSQAATGAYSVRGLVGGNNASTPNTKFDLGADAVTLKSTNGTPSFTRFGTGALTNDIGAVQSGSQANGRDQIATFSASIWIHFYFISNGTTLATLSSTVAPATGPTMPSGYTHWAYAGAVYYNATPLLVQTRFRGCLASYPTLQGALFGGGATTETAVSLATFVPPNALNIQIGTRSTCSDNAGPAGTDLLFRVVSGLNFMDFAAITQVASIGYAVNGNLMIPNVGQNLYYLWTSSGSTRSANITVHGYTMPNGGE